MIRINTYNYTLIISQYYYSRHFFMVKHGNHFLENAREFATELMTYKRGEDYYKKEFYLGDLDPQYVQKEIRSRYNINDAGDIYFLQSNYANYLMCESWSYKEDTRRESRGFQKKVDEQAISDRHNYGIIKDIVERHFEIA